MTTESIRKRLLQTLDGYEAGPEEAELLTSLIEEMIDEKMRIWVESGLQELLNKLENIVKVDVDTDDGETIKGVVITKD